MEKKKKISVDNWHRAWEVAYQAENQPQTLLENPQQQSEGNNSDCRNVCPVCESEGYIAEDSSSFRIGCTMCGTILDIITDDRPEWSTRNESKMFTKDTARGEAINPLMPHASMCTDIVPSSRLPYRQYKMIKLNRWGTMSPMERSLCVVFEKIETACNRHRVPNSVAYTTKAFFRRVYESNLEKQQQGRKREGLRGLKRDGLIAACLYMAFKGCDLYWTKKRVADVFEIDSAEVRRGLQIFWDLMKDQPLSDRLVHITGCKQYIIWYSVELGLPPGLCTFACKLYKNLKHEGIGTSKQPQSTAAGCLWSVCQQLCPNVSMDDVVNATGISKATIKDVERLMDGAERMALAGIFAEDLCQINKIQNPLTQNKVEAVVKALCRLDGVFSEVTAWTLAGFALYFVLVVNDIFFIEDTFLDKSRLPHETLLQLTKQILPYRDAIINCFVGGIQTSSPASHDQQTAVRDWWIVESDDSD